MIDAIAKDLVDICIKECKKEQNRNDIQEHIIGPTMEYIMIYIKPYVIITSIFFVTIVILIAAILMLVLYPTIFKKIEPTLSNYT
jgi:hypothetical protein